MSADARDLRRLLDLLCGGALTDPDVVTTGASRIADAYESPFKQAQREWQRLSDQKEAFDLAHRLRAEVVKGDEDART